MTVGLDFYRLSEWAEKSNKKLTLTSVDALLCAPAHWYGGGRLLMLLGLFEGGRSSSAWLTYQCGISNKRLYALVDSLRFVSPMYTNVPLTAGA